MQRKIAAPATPCHVSGLRRAHHPFVYAILYLPFGAAGGFAAIALGFRATRSGLTVNQGAEIYAVFMGVQVIKWLYAPISDLTLTRKRWYWFSLVAIAASFYALCSVPLSPASLRTVEALVVLNSIASSFLGFAVEALIAHHTSEAEHGPVSGWLQAGNLGGNALGGGLALWLLTHSTGFISGMVLALTTLACGAFAVRLADVPAEARGRSVAGAIGQLGTDLWHTIRSRLGLMSAILCFLPIGTGAASTVLTQADVAAHWGAGADQVALTQGLLAGLACILGALAGGEACRRLRPLVAYCVFGTIMAAVALALLALPPQPWVYVAFAGFGYNFTSGLCYAAFGAIAFDAIGAGNAATKYNGYACLSNVPIWYMGLVLAHMFTRFGPAGLLLSEALAALAAIALYSLLLKRFPSGPAPAEIASQSVLPHAKGRSHD